MLKHAVSAGVVAMLLLSAGLACAAASTALGVSKVTIYESNAEIEHSGTVGTEFTLQVHERNSLADVVRSLRVEPAALKVMASDSAAWGAPHAIHVTMAACDCVSLRYRVTGVEVASQYTVATSLSCDGNPVTTATQFLVVRNGTHDTWPAGWRLIVDRPGLRRDFGLQPQEIAPECSSTPEHATRTVTYAVIAARSKALPRHVIHRFREDRFKPNAEGIEIGEEGLPSFLIKAAWPKDWEDPGPIEFVQYGRDVGSVIPTGTTASERRDSFTAIRTRESIDLPPPAGANAAVQRTVAATVTPAPGPFGDDPRQFAYQTRTVRTYENTGDLPVDVYGDSGGSLIVLPKKKKAAPAIQTSGVDVLTVAFGAATEPQVTAQAKRLNTVVEVVKKQQAPLPPEVDRLSKLAKALDRLGKYFNVNDQFLATRRQQIFDETAANRPDVAAGRRAEVELAASTARMVVEVYNEYVLRSARDDELTFDDVLREHFSVLTLAAETPAPDAEADCAGAGECE